MYNIGMSAKLSVLMITKNAAETLEKSLASVKKIADEIIIVDSKSTDRTVEIAKNYLAKVYVKEFTDIGKQRIFGLSKATGKWVLILDCDEIVSEKLMKEMEGLAGRLEGEDGVGDIVVREAELADFHELLAVLERVEDLYGEVVL